MPDHKFLQELENHTFEPWDATEDEKRAKGHDEEIINDALETRAAEEGTWRWAASRWNLLNEPVDDPRISNVLLPFVRMIASTAISSLSEAHRKNRYKPRQRSDDPKSLLWQSASDHVDNACGMRSEMDDFYTNYVVLGNAALEDYVHLPHVSKRFKVGGEWKHKSVRDFSRPRIGTRSRSPWEFGFWTGTKNPNELTPTFVRDFYSYNVFVQEFSNVYLPNGSPKYINCNHVAPGADCFFTTEGNTKYEPMDHNGVSVITFQDPVRDIYRMYANGVLIFDQPLHVYNRIQKTTLSIATNNHKYDQNLRVTSPYGYGESHLLQGLDALYQAIGNLNIDNYKLANTNLISIRNSGGVTAIDEDFDYLSGVRVEGDVIVSPMGTVRLGEFQGFKDMIDQWAKWTTKVSFDQLLAENKSKTAFELQQQIRAASQGTQYKMTKLAAGAFRKHSLNRLSFILSDMTVEEYMDLEESEIPEVMELLKNNKAPKEDYEYEDGLPKRRVMREKIMVKNRNIKENYVKGERSIDELQDLGPAKFDSEVTVTGKTFWPLEYIESGAVPDIEVEVDLGTERELRFQKMQYLSNYGRQRITESAMNPDTEELKTKFDAQKIDEELVRSIEGVSKDAVMTSETADEEIEKVDETMRDLKKLSSPPLNAQAPRPPISGVENVDAEGLGTFGGSPSPAQSPTAQAAAGVL